MKLSLPRQVWFMTKITLYGVFLQALLCSVLLAETGNAQKLKLKDVYLSINLENVKMQYALVEIGRKTDFNFLYDEDLIYDRGSISVNANNESLLDLLKSIAKNKNLKFKRINENIYITEKGMFQSEVKEIIEQPLLFDRDITGTVTDETGSGLPGVNVLVKGMTTGTITDTDGNYRISVPDNATTLVFSYVGYLNEEVDIAGRSVIDLQLVPDVSTLSEVVVTALGIEKDRKSLGYSVGEIGGEEVSQAKEVNFMNNLQGKVAGVNITRPASGPAGSTRVIIRGSGSITGTNQPLYVVDGVPIDNSNLGASGAWGGRDYGDGISNLNPDDIESISVLKGPNGSALYGERGANGVVLITTKTGKGKGSMEVSLSTNVSFGRASVLPEFQDTYGQGINGQFTHVRQADGTVVANDGVATGTPQGFPAPTGGAPEGPPSWGPRMEGQPYIDVFGNQRTFSPQPDNYEDFFDTEKILSTNLSISGSNDQLNYVFSGSYLNNQGLLPTNELDRYTANIRVGAKLFEKLSADVKINYIRQESINRPNLTDEQQNVAYALRYIPRDVPLSTIQKFETDEDDLIAMSETFSGSQLQTGVERHWSSGTFTGNPYWSVNKVRNEDARDRTLGLIKLTYDITDWLQLTGRVGTDFITEQRLEYQDLGTRVGPNGNISERVYRIRETNADYLLSASKQVSSDFFISASFGGNTRINTVREAGYNGSNFSLPNFPVISNAANDAELFSFEKSKITSIYGFGQFGYKDFLFLDWTARNDWSSYLEDGFNSFFYPSVSVSAVISEMVELPTAINFLKLRSSWAQAGSSGEPYQTRGSYTLGIPLNGQLTASFARPGSENVPFRELQNELTTAFEIGADVQLLDSRLGIDFTYYSQFTENQIIPLTIPWSSGFNGRQANVGRVDNNGIELLLTGTPVKTASGFTWDVSFNYTRNRSELVELLEGVESFNTGNADRNLNTFTDVGEPFGQIIARTTYLKDAQGNRLINPTTGLPIRSDEDGLIGNALPDWLGGLRNSFSYKGLDLSIFLDIKQGGDIYSQSSMYMSLYGTGEWTEANREGGFIAEGMIAQEQADGTWTSTGQPNDIGVTAQEYWLNAAPGSTTAVAEEFLYDGSYIAIREIVLGYTLPASVLEKLPFKYVRLALTGRNLGYIEKHTPGFAPDAFIFNREPVGNAAVAMESLSFPTSRIIGFNVNLKF